MIRSLVLMSVAALVAASCGEGALPGSRAGPEGARDAASAWYRALADTDADTACRLMTTSMRTRFTSGATNATCEDGISTYSATLDEPAKNLMKSNDFILTPNGNGVVYVRPKGSWKAPTVEQRWTDRRWWISAIIE